MVLIVLIGAAAMFSLAIANLRLLFVAATLDDAEAAPTPRE